MKTKFKLLACLLAALMLLGCAACAEPPGPDPGNGGDGPVAGGTEDGTGGGTPEKPAGKNVFADEKYENGFTLRGTGADGYTRDVVKTYSFREDTAPVWGLAQWYSRYQLENGKETSDEEQFLISDTSKSVRVDRKTGALTLSLNGAEEFDGVQAPGSVFWPHLLLEQGVTPKRLDECETLRAQLSFTVDRAADRSASFGEIPICMQAQFAWFIYIQNVDPDSGGMGEFLWFGFNLYDPTRLYAPGTSQQDFAGGTLGNYIYTLGASESLGKESVKVGKQVSFDMDLFPAVEKALDKAHKAGFMTHTELENCAVTGMNIGFEVFDVWDISVTIHNMRVAYTDKED